MKKATESGYLVALDIAENLVQQGIPFRTTHKIAGSLVQTASQSKKPLNKLTPNEIKKSVEGTKIESKLVRQIILSTTISSSLKDRKSLGSSSYSEQIRMIEDRTRKINVHRIDTTKRTNDVSHALDELSFKISELIK